VRKAHVRYFTELDTLTGVHKVTRQEEHVYEVGHFRSPHAHRIVINTTGKTVDKTEGTALASSKDKDND
jgi:hypothetical protein